MDVGVLKCKYRKDDNEEYKTHSIVSGVVSTSLAEVQKRPNEDLEVCGVCGNPDVVHEDGNYIGNDDSWTLSWVECEVCKQWYHQDCIGIYVDTNDFICSDKCISINRSRNNKTGWIRNMEANSYWHVPISHFWL